MNVRELKEIIKDLPDDMEVVEYSHESEKYGLIYVDVKWGKPYVDKVTIHTPFIGKVIKEALIIDNY